jgi:hypothetical protein
MSIIIIIMAATQDWETVSEYIVDHYNDVIRCTECFQKHPKGALNRDQGPPDANNRRRRRYRCKFKTLAKPRAPKVIIPKTTLLANTSATICQTTYGPRDVWNLATLFLPDKDLQKIKLLFSIESASTDEESSSDESSSDELSVHEGPSDHEEPSVPSLKRDRDPSPTGATPIAKRTQSGIVDPYLPPPSFLTSALSSVVMYASPMN